MDWNTPTLSRDHFETAYRAYTFTVVPNEDREGVNLYITCPNGDSCSLACADNEGETVDGTRIPGHVVAAAYDFLDWLTDTVGAEY